VTETAKGLLPVTLRAAGHQLSAINPLAVPGPLRGMIAAAGNGAATASRLW
jgi:hypothetical protein